MCLDVRIKSCMGRAESGDILHIVFRGFAFLVDQYLMRGRGALVRGLLHTQCRWWILGLVHYENKIPQNTVLINVM